MTADELQACILARQWCCDTTWLMESQKAWFGFWQERPKDLGLLEPECGAAVVSLRRRSGTRQRCPKER